MPLDAGAARPRRPRSWTCSPGRRFWRSSRRASTRRTSRSTRRAQLRYAGSDTTIEVELGSAPAMRRAFEAAHKARFGFLDRTKAIVIEAVVGGGGGRRGALFRARRFDAARRASAPDARAADEVLLQGRVAGGRTFSCARRWRSGEGRRPGARHRAAPDDRRRGGLARGDHAEEPRRHDARRAAAEARGDRRERPIR